MGPNDGGVLIAETSGNASTDTWLTRKREEQQRNAQQHSSAPSSSTFGSGEKFSDTLAAERVENETMKAAAEVDGVINGGAADSLESGTAVRERVGAGTVERGAVNFANTEMSQSAAYNQAQQRRAAEQNVDANRNQLTAGKNITPPKPEFAEPAPSAGPSGPR